MEEALSLNGRPTEAVQEKCPLAVKPKSESPALALLRQRNFQLRMAGGTVSCLGDQFYLIALPWLVLQLTGNAFAMGTVLALAGIPRALFMLVGGAISDRLSPRSVMIWSNLVRMVLVALLAALTLTGSIQFWMLYGFALVFGLADAFFYPAVNAILPQIVGKEYLGMGNALMQGAVQVSLFLGPVLAGALIAAFGDSPAASGSVPGREGIGLAFAINAGTFLFSVITLWLIRIPREREEADKASQEQGLLASIREVLVSVWNDEVLRIFFLVVAAINFVVNGPFIVGIPVLANSRLAEGAMAYGVIMSAWGGGSLLGIVLAGVLPKPSSREMSFRMLLVTAVTGLTMAALGIAQTTALAAGAGLVMGAAGGYISILFMTWLQARTPQAMLGRVMSLLMFAAVGLMPVSTALAGALIDWNFVAVFLGAGALVVALVGWISLNPALRHLDMSVEETEGEAAA